MLDSIGDGHPALRYTTQRGVPDPVLQVSSGEHIAHQTQHPVVVDVLSQCLEHDPTVKPIEAPGNITLDEPGGPSPGNRHLAQSGVAAPARTKTVRTRRELRLVVRL